MANFNDRARGAALRSGLLLGVSAAALGIAAPALAQTAEGEQTPVGQDSDVAAAEDDTIVVTGLRASIASAQSIKQNTDQFVDSITAIDIGKLPDVNVAEALQRVSGIQITRNRGEGSSIAIRGLTQVRTEVNGRDSFSANNGRALSFEDVPSELLAGVDVYKNPSAELIEGGIGGLVNLRTRMPFDQSGNLYSVTLGTNYYDLIEELKLNISGLVSQRWETGIGEVGILLSASYFEGAFRTDTVTIEPFWDRADIPDFIGETRSVAAGAGVSTTWGERTREGYYGALQWRPAHNLEFYATGFQSRYYITTPNFSYFGFGPSGSGGALTPVPDSFAFDEDGNMERGSFLNIPVNNNSGFPQQWTTTTDVAGGFKWEISDRLKLKGDLQRIDSSTQAQNLILYGAALNGGTFNMDLTGDTPAISISPNALVADPSNYYYSAIQDHRDDNDGDEWAARLDLEWEFDDASFLRSLNAGGRYTDRSATNRSTSWGTSWSGISATWDGSGMIGSVSDPASPGGGAVTFAERPNLYVMNPYAADFFRGAGTNIIGVAPYINPALGRDIEATVRYFSSDAFNPTPSFAGRGLTPFTPIDTNTQAERTYAGYAMLRFGNDEGFRFDGNIGVRYVKTKTEADGFASFTYRSDPSDPNSANIVLFEPLSVSRDYDHWLPSLNIRAFLADKLQLRLAASRGLARPNFDQITANYTVSEVYRASTPPPPVGTPDPGVFFRYEGSGGNPYLEPMTVSQADAALEWYPKSTTMLYGTVFYKKVQNFIQNGVFESTIDTPNRGTVPYRITQQVNGTDGTIKGFEIGGNTFFDFLPGALSGLGVQANLTYVDSSAPSPTATDTAGNPLIVPLEGLSKWSYNLIGLYEKYGFSLRVAYNWRDAWVKTTAGTGTGNLPIFSAAYGQLDALLAYDINEHVTVAIQGVNLTNTLEKSYQFTPNRPRDYILNDRRIGGSLRFKF